MKTPSFWNSDNIVSTLLLPASQLYAGGYALRRLLARPVTLPVPVICVGNLTAGGGGKTPVALHIGARLKEKNSGTFFLSRGYGGSLSGPVRVDPTTHTASEVGDEPLLLAKLLPTIIAKNRADGGRFTATQGAKSIIMDDGFQNPTLTKTLSLLVIDGQTGFGNGRLLPAGPLREPAQAGLERADAIIVINPARDLPLAPGKPILFARTQPTQEAAVKGKKLIAFCGIAVPRKFFNSLIAMGAEHVEAITFPDHHPYQKSDLKALANRAEKTGRPLVTTAKDAVRLPPEFRVRVIVVDITLAFEDEAMLDSILDNVLSHYGKP